MPFTPATLQPKLVWLYGPTGSGKSFYLRSRYPNAFIKQPDSNWKGYTGQDSVAIEDLEPTVRKTFQFNFVRWLTNEDIAAYINPYKKKFIRPSVFVVTSYYHPLDFKHLKPFIKQVLSHCEIIHCTYITNGPGPEQEVIPDFDFELPSCTSPTTSDLEPDSEPVVEEEDEEDTIPPPSQIVNKRKRSK